MSSSGASVAPSNSVQFHSQEVLFPWFLGFSWAFLSAALNCTSASCQGLSMPPSPVTESSLPAIWWLSQLQNPISEILGPLLVPSVAGWVPWHLASEMICIRKSFGESRWDQPSGRGELKEVGYGRRSGLQCIHSEGHHRSHRGACQSCPTLGKGCLVLKLTGHYM